MSSDIPYLPPIGREYMLIACGFIAAGYLCVYLLLTHWARKNGQIE
jgi:hypothetical protein